MADPVIEPVAMTFEGGVIQGPRADTTADFNGNQAIVSDNDSNIIGNSMGGPCAHNEIGFTDHAVDDVDGVRRIMHGLKHIPRNADNKNMLSWSRMVWAQAYERDPSPDGGSPFSVSLDPMWGEFVAADALTRLHKYLDPAIRVVAYDNDEGEPSVLAVEFSEHADPTSLRHIGHFADTWKLVCEWKRHLLANCDPDCPIDEFAYDRMLQFAATKFQSVRRWF